MDVDTSMSFMSPTKNLEFFTDNFSTVPRGERVFFSPDRLRTSYRSPKSWSSPECSEFMKRGRPKAALIKTLMNQGSATDSSIRCSECHRVFPREKSLAAHMRTHTGEKPYACDYPNCTKAFCQSGQLKTHQRLHTGEKPFICAVQDCNNRFTHSNRHCTAHPEHALLRDEENMPVPMLDEKSPSPIKQWMQKHLTVRTGRTPHKGRTSPSRSSTKRLLFGSPQAEQNVEEASTKQTVVLHNRKRLVFTAEDLAFHATPPKKNCVGISEDTIRGALALIELAQGFC